MKIAVVGGGSTYTPELVSGLTRLDVSEFVLHDIDPERREVVGGMAKRMLDRQSYAGSLLVTDELDRAVEGADFVLVQIRVGGQQARLHDETAPLACGCIGQETTGAGGFAKAMRTVPVVLEIADRVRALAKPEAWIVDFTNPVGIVTRALLDAGHRAIGLCNVAIGFQRKFAAFLDVEPNRVVVDQVGLNHLTWVRAVLLDGRDVLPELFEAHGQEIADHVDVPLRLLGELGAVPSYYLHYFYAHDAVLEEQRVGVPRAQVVSGIEHELLELYRDPNLVERPALLMRRGGAYYSEAALGLVGSLTNDDGVVHEVDVRNDGTLVGLADDDVVEVPARVGRGGAEPLAQRPLAPELLGLVQHVAAYERLTARAAVTRDLVDARKALLTHPLIGQLDLVDGLLEALVEERRAVTVALAVDGGNSKTDVVLVRDDGTVLGSLRGPQCSPHHLGLDQSLDVLTRLAADAGEPADLAMLMLAGVDFADEEDAYREAAERRGLATRVVVGNDTFAVLRAGTAAGWGVAVTCGAGINCVGVAPDGRRVRFASLGAISGDWGGGADVGMAAAEAAARSEDGRGPKTVLEQLVPAHLGFVTPTELARAYTAGKIVFHDLRTLAPLTFEAAADDAVAASILDRLADEVAAMAVTALGRLGLIDEPVEVVLGGGLLQSGNERLLGQIDERIHAAGPALRVKIADVPPIVGAALLALDELGADADAQRRLRAEL